MLFPSPTITIDAALRDLGSPDPRVRAAAADALGDVPDAERPRAAQAVVGVLGDALPEVRCTAAFALGALGETIAVAPLLERLEDGDTRVRQAAAVALGRIGDARAFAPLAKALRDGPPDLRYQAALSLAEIDPAGSFDPLVAAIGDPDPEVRGNVAASLGLVGDRRAAGWIAELLVNGNRDTRFEAACALARLGDARGIETLWAFLDADHFWRAVDALEWTGDKRAVGPLAVEMRRLLAGKLVRVRAAVAVLALDPTHGGAKYARELLEKASRSRRPDVRGLAQEALNRLDGRSEGDAEPSAPAPRR